MRKNHPPALTAEQYAKGAASAAGYEFGSALLLHLVGFAWATALLAGLGISVLFVLSFAAARGIAARRGHRQQERSRPESQGCFHPAPKEHNSNPPDHLELR